MSSIPIPLLKDEDVQRNINEIALAANQKRYEAYKLEQQALRIIDKESHLSAVISLLCES